MDTIKTISWIAFLGVAIIVFVIVGLNLVLWRWPQLRGKMLTSLLTCPDLATFIATRKALRSSIEDRLQAADADTRVILQNKLNDLNGMIDNPKEELPKTRQRVFGLKSLLKKHGKTINKARLLQATEALEIEDYRPADLILAEIATKPGIKVKTAAQIAFGRGDIARSEFRWQDAVNHYNKAAQFTPSYLAFSWSHDCLSGLEQHKEAALVGQKLVAFAREKYGNNSKLTVAALSNLAWSHYRSDDSSSAESCCRDLLAIVRKSKGMDMPEYILDLKLLAILLEERSDYDAAEPVLREIVEIKAGTLGEAHPDYVVSLSRLAMLLDDKEDYAAAEPLYRKVLELTENTIGREDSKYVKRLFNLAGMLREKGDFDAAEPLYREALEIEARTIGTDHAKYATRLNQLAVLLVKKGDYNAAEPLYHEALLIDENTVGKNSSKYALHLANVAALWFERGDYVTAEPLFREALDIYAKTVEGYHYCYGVHRAKFAKILQSRGNFAEAEVLLRQVVVMNEEALGQDHLKSKSARKDLEQLLREMP